MRSTHIETAQAITVPTVLLSSSGTVCDWNEAANGLAGLKLGQACEDALNSAFGINPSEAAALSKTLLVHFKGDISAPSNSISVAVVVNQRSMQVVCTRLRNSELLLMCIPCAQANGHADLAHPLQALADASNDAFLIVDIDGTVLYANKNAHQLAQESVHRQSAPLDCLVNLEFLELAKSEGYWHSEVNLRTVLNVNQPMAQEIRYHQQPGIDPCFLVTLKDESVEKARETELQNRNSELTFAYSQLKEAQEQLLQSEKMASIGQLAAGVAHEINNPIGYVHANLGILHDYTRSLFTLLNAYESAGTKCIGESSEESVLLELNDMRRRLEIDYVIQDLPNLVSESREGIERVRKIVQDLKEFSHVGESEDWIESDLHRGLDTTLSIVWNELKYKTDLDKEFGDLPLVQCLPSQLNQVFLNILVNAGQAIKERGKVSIVTGVEGDNVWISISDTGEGISEESMAKIFDPFFTTKAVGTGTGLGLSLSFGIIKKHNGKIEVSSKLGVGTTFKIILPILQPKKPS